jgi:hypothetical protein
MIADAFRALQFETTSSFFSSEVHLRHLCFATFARARKKKLMTRFKPPY